jgi:hypothetical protein
MCLRQIIDKAVKLRMGTLSIRSRQPDLIQLDEPRFLRLTSDAIPVVSLVLISCCVDGVPQQEAHIRPRSAISKQSES